MILCDFIAFYDLEITLTCINKPSHYPSEGIIFPFLSGENEVQS